MTDTELNERIALALGWEYVCHMPRVLPIETNFDVSSYWWKDGERYWLKLPPWSTSLDACLTLPLPGGYWIRIATSPTSARCWAAIVREAQSFDGEADTPARAFATAWLEMREAQKP